MRLLIVEDDDAIAQVLARLALVAGMSGALRAPSIAEAGRLVHRADAMVLDLNLTNGCGIRLLEDMRAGGVSIPVAVLTGSGSLESAGRAARLGAVDYLEKPATLDELQRMLDRLALRRPGATPDEIKAAVTAGMAHRLALIESINEGCA